MNESSIHMVAHTHPSRLPVSMVMANVRQSGLAGQFCFTVSTLFGLVLYFISYEIRMLVGICAHGPCQSLPPTPLFLLNNASFTLYLPCATFNICSNPPFVASTALGYGARSPFNCNCPTLPRSHWNAFIPWTPTKTETQSNFILSMTRSSSLPSSSCKNNETNFLNHFKYFLSLNTTQIECYLRTFAETYYAFLFLVLLNDSLVVGSCYDI